MRSIFRWKEHPMYFGVSDSRIVEAQRMIGAEIAQDIGSGFPASRPSRKNLPIAADIFQSDSQCDSQSSPEKDLCRAVFKTIVYDLGQKNSKNAECRKRFYEAQQLVFSDSRSWLYSFCNLCDVLGFHIKTTRDVLVRAFNLQE